MKVALPLIVMTCVMGRTMTYEGVGVGKGLGESVCEGMLLFLKKKIISVNFYCIQICLQDINLNKCRQGS